MHQLPESGESDDKAEDKYISIFEQKRLKGWWPCIVEYGDDQRELAVSIFPLNLLS